jgi:dTDP-glucose 4,6-dehydratase
VDRSIEDPEVFLAHNVMGTVNLLNCLWPPGVRATAFGTVCGFWQVSTDEVYGSLGPEGFLRKTSPLDPHSPYAAQQGLGGPCA